MAAAGDVLTVDGGLATELEAAGLQLQGDPLWSARILQTNPQAIKNVHASYLSCGADVITTATYQGSVAGFMKYLGLTSEKADQLLQSGVQLAKEAITEFLSESRSSERAMPLVAGSIGPYGASLHDGSEYSGDYVDQMTKEDEQYISHGERFADAVKFVINSDQLVAVGLNCCPPDIVSSLLATVEQNKRPKGGWIIYPNRGESWNPNTGWGNGPVKSQLAELALEWKELGAKWIGGCCRTTPADIAELRCVLKPNLQLK
ncbi:betaine-homocysteine S-methyltransferase isoform X2 [Rhinoraja longicauda]